MLSSSSFYDSVFKTCNSLTLLLDHKSVPLPWLQRMPNSGMYCCPPPYTHNSERDGSAAKISLSKTWGYPLSKELGNKPGSSSVLHKYSNSWFENHVQCVGTSVENCQKKDYERSLIFWKFEKIEFNFFFIKCGTLQVKDYSGV